MLGGTTGRPVNTESPNDGSPYRIFGRMVSEIIALAGSDSPEAMKNATRALHTFLEGAPEDVLDYLAYVLVELTRQLMEATGADPKRYIDGARKVVEEE
jgi:hypothetical protein